MNRKNNDGNKTNVTVPAVSPHLASFRIYNDAT